MTDDPAQDRILLHPLGFRRDGTEWIVGRPDTGTFVTMPTAGVRVIHLLGAAVPPAEVRQRIHQETGTLIEIDAFIDSLCRLGFVRSLNGQPVASAPPARSSLPRVKPDQVRWTLNPVLHALLAALALTGLAVPLIQPQLRLHWTDLLWSNHGTAVLLGEAALTWLLLMLHELAHLFTARAAGVPGTIRLGTRLQFLVVQTDVSGIWLSPRRTRITVYLAGLLLDLSVVGCTLLTQLLTGPNRALAAVAATQLGAILTEFMVFTRTDLYFVLQDLLGCRNLYHDAAAFVRFTLARASGRPATDPLIGLSRPEGNRVRAYAVVMLLGSAACLTMAAEAWHHVVWAMLTRAGGELFHATSWLSALDALTTILLLLGPQALWATVWWRQRRSRHR
ncbi:hypothetical protein [Kitasatospora sp. NPDC001175]|uniref:hypothetical protein n=1 Tax=Kitasatospora sp. NPDC001175 TaxID=3157103 RepID=UPI003D00CDFB